LRGVAAALALSVSAAPATASDRLCDVSFENCRAQLLDLIRNETVRIDVAFWFMEDARYSNELIKKWNAGVPIRVLVDPRANASNPLNGDRLAELAAAGIPMRKRIANGILHWKVMLFAGQNTVEFSAANYSPEAFVPEVPYLNYVDEVIYTTDEPSILNSFMTKYDDLWTNTTAYADYANISGPLTRAHGTFTKDPELNFPPTEDFGKRSVSRYNAETQKIDAIMYRITDRRHTDALINAVGRGIPVRLITEPKQYRDPTRLWHSWNVDRLYMAGVQIRHRRHDGLLHQKSTMLYGLGLTIFGSSNWSSPSATSQEEHNYFTTKPVFFEFFRQQFERKWNNLTGNEETEPFAPLPPDTPLYSSPVDQTTGLGTVVTLVWDPGPFAHKYDIYFGTTPSPPLLAADLALGPNESGTQFKQYTLTGLANGTTYYWRVVSKTMANMTGSGPEWTFTTGGIAPPPTPNGVPGPGDIVLHAGTAAVMGGGWTVVNDSAAASALRIAHPNGNLAKIATPLANPTHYFEMSFAAEAGKPYRLWMRGRAQDDSWANDSVHVQFSGSVNASGSPVYRIGTTTSTEVNLEDCSGCGLSGWGWQDNGYGRGVLGPLIHFQTTGAQTIRVQTREDGFTIDQILLSPEKFLTTSPGALKNDATIFPASDGSGEPPPPPPPPPSTGEIVLYAMRATTLAGRWRVEPEPTAAGGALVHHPNNGDPKITTPLANPGDYVELTFNAEAGKSYRLWIRGRADGNSWANDSVWVQFSGSVDATGAPVFRIGTASGTDVNLEDCSGCGLSGWGWQDNGWGVGVVGPLISFETTGLQTIRLQTREDGFSIDQIVLSSSQYAGSSPGALKNDTIILAETSPPGS
jgi:phosphatidylserine/phosphatidylglycerophosphate/cardiolipin synthase-like enzyme